MVMLYEPCHPFSTRCQVSGVTGKVSCVFFFLNLQSGESSRWKVCYQQSLLRLVTDLAVVMLLNSCLNSDHVI